MPKHYPDKLRHLWYKMPRELSPDQAIGGSIQNRCRHEERLTAHELKFIRLRNRLDTRCNDLEIHIDEVETDLNIRIDGKIRMTEIRISELRAKIEALENRNQLLETLLQQQEERLKALEHFVVMKFDQEPIIVEATEHGVHSSAEEEPDTPQ